MSDRVIVKGNIGNALHSVAPDHISTTSNEVFDETQQQYQDDLNAKGVRVESQEFTQSQKTQALANLGVTIGAASDFTNPDTAKRAKIVTVGAALDGLNDGVYDVSKRNPTGGENSDGKFTLEYILSHANTLIPTSWRHGGMSISFVQSTDNKYVEYFLPKDEWSVSEADWEKMNLEEEVSQLGQNIALITCNTAAGTAAKSISIEGFGLLVGGCVKIKFTYGSTAENITLNINGTGAYPVLFNDSPVSGNNKTIGKYLLYGVFDGAYWRLYTLNTLYQGINNGLFLHNYSKLWNGGTLITVNNYTSTDKLPICNFLVIWFYDGGSQYPNYGLQFFDEDGDYIGRYNTGESAPGYRTLYLSANDYPANAKYFSASIDRSVINRAFIVGIESDIIKELNYKINNVASTVIPMSQKIENLSDEVENIQGNFVQPTKDDIQKGKYLYSDRTWKSGATLGYCIVDVSKITGAAITETKLEEASVLGRYAFLKSYNESGVVFSDINGYNEGYIDNVTVPADANYLYVLTTTTSNWDFLPFFESIGIKKGEIPELHEDVQELNNKVNSILQDLYIRKTATEVSIFRKYKNGKYIRELFVYQYMAYAGGTTYPDNYDVWLRSSAYLGQFDDELNWTDIAALTGGPLQELAVDVPADNTAGHNYVGGSAHGFEKIVVSDNVRNITMLVDGEKIGETDVITLRPITSFEVFQKSMLFQAYTNSNEFAEVDKYWVWNKNESKCKMSTKILRDIRIVYFQCGMMLVPQRYNLSTGGDFVGNKAIKENLPYTEYTLEGAWSGSIPINNADAGCTQIFEYGDLDFGYSLKVLTDTRKEGTGASGMFVWNNGGTTFNKIYNCLAALYNSLANEVFSAEVEWIIR